MLLLYVWVTYYVRTVKQCFFFYNMLFFNCNLFYVTTDRTNLSNWACVYVVDVCECRKRKI